MTPPRWVGKEALLVLHEESIARFGGASGLRDEGLLDSALARPRNAYAYDTQRSIAQLAASYAFGLVRNHPFVDGNKRAALLALGVFLALNAYHLTASQAAATRAIMALAEGSMDEAAMAVWVAENCRLETL